MAYVNRRRVLIDEEAEESLVSLPEDPDGLLLLLLAALIPVVAEAGMVRQEACLRAQDGLVISDQRSCPSFLGWSSILGFLVALERCRSSSQRCLTVTGKVESRVTRHRHSMIEGAT